MVDIITESDLRDLLFAAGTKQFTVAKDTYVTPSAKEYLQQKGIVLVRADKIDTEAILNTGQAIYTDITTGQGYRQKPEELTQLKDNLLVGKAHPRIAFRGKLDSLQACMLLLLKQADAENLPLLYSHLKELLEYCRQMMAAEVLDTPLEERLFWGLSQEEVHYLSHHIKESFSITEATPQSDMSNMALQLNWLRTQVRETEVAAAQAFIHNAENDRPDILQGLNRLSSAVFVLYCRVLSGYY